MKKQHHKFSSLISLPAMLRKARQAGHLSSPKGFTLIELLVVIAILGVLSVGLIAAIDPVDKLNAASDSRVINDIGVMARASESFATNNGGGYPKVVGDLVGELKVVPAQPSGYSAYVLTSSPGACTVAAKDCTSVVITGQLKSKKYAPATPFWRYESTTAKSCARADATTACP